MLSCSFFVKLKNRLDSSLSDPFTHCSEAFKEDLDFMEGKAGKVKKAREGKRAVFPPVQAKKNPNTHHKSYF